MLPKSLLKMFFGFALLICANLLQAQPGTLDPTFGSGGRVLTTLANGSGMVIRSVAIQADNKLIGAGAYNSSSGTLWSIGRYNSNGTLDNTFGVNGLDTSAAFFGGLVYGVAVQSDGKIVAAGYLDNGNLTVARYNTDGSLDNSFGTNGITSISNIRSGSFAFSIAIQNDGKILAGGGYNDANYHGRFLLVRLNTNGTFDNSFGTNGIAPEIVIGPTDDEIRSLAVQPDGKIIAAGYSQNSGSNYLFAMVRYNINGGVDATFGSNGIVTTAIMTYAQAWSVALQSDEKILLSGTSYDASSTSFFALVRYNTDGTLDNGFGVQTLAVDGGSQAYAMQVQNDGKIVEAGTLAVDASKFAMVRYLPSGALDNSFAVNGVDTTSMGNQNSAVAYAVRLVNSRIYLAGTTGSDWGIAAYTNDAGALPVTLLNFDGSLKNGNALLTWSTANEINNKGFEIFRSADGTSFTSIGFVTGAGNSDLLLNYQFTDKPGLSGKVFYRLKQVDLDGNFAWSNIVHVTMNANQLITFMPNPAKNFITISSPVNVKEVRLLAISSQIIKVWQNVSPNTQLDLGSIASGTYLIQFLNDQSSQTMKLVKE